MENFGVIDKEYYGMLWYFLELSIAFLKSQYPTFHGFRAGANVKRENF